MEKLEKRSFVNKVNFSDRLVEGYAVLFNQESKDLGFYETIEPNAITEEVINKSDVFALLNHDREKVLARSNKGIGNLVLEIDERGLKYCFEALNNSLGDDIIEYLNKGMITESSFAFTVAKEEWVNKDGTYHRTIKEIDELFDVSPVWVGAYANTDVAVAQRSLDNFKASEAKEDLTNYFDNLKIQYND